MQLGKIRPSQPPAAAWALLAILVAAPMPETVSAQQAARRWDGLFANAMAARGTLPAQQDDAGAGSSADSANGTDGELGWSAAKGGLHYVKRQA